MPAVLICVIGAVSLPAGPAAVIEPGQAAFGGLFVLMGEVEAGFVHGFADHVVADISGAAEAVAQVAGVAATALRSMQGTWTRPQMGSQVRPR